MAWDAGLVCFRSIRGLLGSACSFWSWPCVTMQRCISYYLRISSGSQMYTWMHLKLLSNNGNNLGDCNRFTGEISSLGFSSHTMNWPYSACNKFGVDLPLPSLWSLQALPLWLGRVHFVACCVLKREWWVSVHGETLPCCKGRGCREPQCDFSYTAWGPA